MKIKKQVSFSTGGDDYDHSTISWEDFRDAVSKISDEMPSADDQPMAAPFVRTYSGGVSVEWEEEV